jgi:hypothetical protein
MKFAGKAGENLKLHKGSHHRRFASAEGTIALVTLASRWQIEISNRGYRIARQHAAFAAAQHELRMTIGYY